MTLTAAPLATKLGLTVTPYNPSELKDFAEALKKQEGTILIVGHSNTTPPLVTLLSGQATDPIDDSEYDNLYQIVRVGEQAKVTRFRIFPITQITEKNH